MRSLRLRLLSNLRNVRRRFLPCTLLCRSDSSSDNGSGTTIYMPPTDMIPNLPSPTISTASMLSSPFCSARPLPVPQRRAFPPMASQTATESLLSPLTRATGDSVLSPGMRSFGDMGARLIPPSRSSSICRTTSMTDLESEFETLTPASPRSVSTDELQSCELLIFSVGLSTERR